MVQADVWLMNQQLVPTVRFGLQSNESATAMFSAANFPGASTADITQAQNLYATLTGRISQILGEARITTGGDAYVPLGPLARRRSHARVRLFCGRHMACHTDVNCQRRITLRARESFLPGEQQLHDCLGG